MRWAFTIPNAGKRTGKEEVGEAYNPADAETTRQKLLGRHGEQLVVTRDGVEVPRDEPVKRKGGCGL